MPRDEVMRAFDFDVVDPLFGQALDLLNAVPDGTLGVRGSNCNLHAFM